MPVGGEFMRNACAIRGNVLGSCLMSVLTFNVNGENFLNDRLGNMNCTWLLELDESSVYIITNNVINLNFCRNKTVSKRIVK